MEKECKLCKIFKGGIHMRKTLELRYIEEEEFDDRRISIPEDRKKYASILKINNPTEKDILKAFSKIKRKVNDARRGL